MRLNLPPQCLPDLTRLSLAPLARRRPELAGPAIIVPTQVAIYYDNSNTPTLIDGSTEIDGDGNATVVVPIVDLPSTGNPIQIVIQPYPDMDPIFVSGQLQLRDDGSYNLNIDLD